MRVFHRANEPSSAASRGVQTLYHGGSLIGVTDGQLLERFAVRDGEASEAAFAALVERHSSLVWRTCRAMLRDEHEAADAFQATFLVLVKKAGSLWVRDSIAPWLHRVAFRAANQARIAVKWRRQAERRAAELNAGRTEDTMTYDLAEILHKEIDRLPHRHRIVVILCDLEERSYEEAARHLGCAVGTVKSRLARARQRLRTALSRRGVFPSAMSRERLDAIVNPSAALTAATIRGSVLFATDPNTAAGVVSTTAVLLAEGVLRAMIRAKLQSSFVVMLAMVGLAVPAWFAHAHQGIEDRPEAKGAATGQKIAHSVVALNGNWILRAYPGGNPIALVGIEGSDAQSHATLRSVVSPANFDLARSMVAHERIDGKTVGLTLQLFVLPMNAIRSIEIVALRPNDEANPRVLRGSWIEGSGRDAGRGRVLPITLERTDRAALDPGEAEVTAAGWADFQRYNQSENMAEKKEILVTILTKYGDTPIAPCAAWCLAIDRADSGATDAEVRGLIDQASRIAARHGRLMEIGAINMIVDNLIGAADREALVLEYARKAVAQLHPDDLPALQISTLRILTSALRKADKIDANAATAEVGILESRMATLARREGLEPAKASPAEARVRGDGSPWARSFAAALKRARAEGKLIMIAIDIKGPDWTARLDAEVFARPEVLAAMSAFVPVKVNAEDGAVRSLVARHAPELSRGYPAILFLDPGNEETKVERLVGKIPGFMPAASVVEQLNTIARLPRDIGPLAAKVRPDDGDAMRQVATALAMRGRVEEAAALIDRAWGPGADPRFDRWAAVYVVQGRELMLQAKLREAGDWFDKAARVAKRPIDAYNARLNAGQAAILRRDPDRAAKELEAAALAEGVSSHEREFANQWVGAAGRPADGPKAAAAPKR